MAVLSLVACSACTAVDCSEQTIRVNVFLFDFLNFMILCAYRYLDDIRYEYSVLCNGGPGVQLAVSNEVRLVTARLPSVRWGSKIGPV